MMCDSCACDFVDLLASRGPSHRYDKQEHWTYFDESVKKELLTTELFLFSVKKCIFQTTQKVTLRTENNFSFTFEKNIAVNEGCAQSNRGRKISFRTLDDVSEN